LHVDPDYWGIGTSEYIFPDFNSVSESENLSELVLYPNPAKTHVLIHSPIALENASIEVLDMTGKLIITPKSVNGSTLPLSISSLEPGVYIIKVSSEKSQWASSLIIEE
jgi:nitrate reductase NapAB chaperone NapD